VPDDKQLIPVSYIKLSLGGPEADGLFMSATLPSGTIMQEERKVYDQQGGNTPIRTPSHIDWQDISLTRGIDKTKAMYDWFIKLGEEGPTPQNCKLVKLELLDNKKQAVMTWSLEGAFISSYQAGTSTAGGGGVATENMTIHYVNAKREV
jgi:phage tail-like protein